MGDVTHIYNRNGQLVGKYSYSAFGKCTIELDVNGVASFNPIRYRGYYYDSETGLYYLNSRYYDPETGRFVTIDDISYLDPDSINGLNLYAYCGNNPVMNIDPNGNAFLSFLIGAAIGLVVGAVSYTAGQVVEYAISGDFEWSWGGFIGSTVGGAVAGSLSPIGLSLSTMAFWGGAAINAGKMIGENIGDRAGHSAGKIIASSLVFGIASIFAVKAMSAVKIRGFNSGRGSFSAVNKQIYTKFSRGLISGISLKTFGKMLALEMYNNLLGFLLGGVLD